MAFAKCFINMKKLFIPALLSVCLFACNSNSNSSSENETSSQSGEETKEAEKKISKRDVSINSQNSYSDLFLDSTSVQNFISDNKVNDTIARRIQSFYNARNYQFAWFASDGLTEQARAFWNLHNHYTTYSKDSLLSDKALKKLVDNFASEETLQVSASGKPFITAELKLTDHFIKYILNTYEPGTVKRKEMERFVPRKREDALYLADSILTKKHKDNKYFENANEPYKLLKQQLQKYYTIVKGGGWQLITGDLKKIKKGSSSPAVLAIKKRLQATGELALNDTTPVFGDALEAAVKTFQTSVGSTPDGLITASLVKELNVPALTRVKTLLLNMDRMRWMPTQQEGNLIIVNIPEFVLHVYEGKAKAFDMKVVVGKEGHNTTMFTGMLNQVVFSPYWNITPDITRKEIMPAMERNPNYLEKNNMEIVSTEGGFPVIRQLPGEGNSLGKVKFLFPNDFNIYFHDTPAKSLFSKDKRAYSHGCIRLSEPVKMAEYILRDNKEWTPEKMAQAMNAGVEKFVKVKDPIPVLITYYTAWVDETGLLSFREDIYNHDNSLIKKMFL